MTTAAQWEHMAREANAAAVKVPSIECSCRFHGPNGDHWDCGRDCGCDGPQAGWQWRTVLRAALAAAPVGGQVDEGSLTTCPSCGEDHTDDDVCRPDGASISQRRDGTWRHDRCDGYVIFRGVGWGSGERGGWECGECGARGGGLSVGGQAEPSDAPEWHRALTWDELKPYEQQQGGYWLYWKSTGIYGEGKTFVRVAPAAAVGGQAEPSDAQRALAFVHRYYENVPSDLRPHLRLDWVEEALRAAAAVSGEQA